LLFENAICLWHPRRGIALGIEALSELFGPSASGISPKWGELLLLLSGLGGKSDCRKPGRSAAEETPKQKNLKN